MCDHTGCKPQRTAPTATRPAPADRIGGRAAEFGDAIASTLEYAHGDGHDAIEFALANGEELALVLDSPSRNGVHGTVYFGDSNLEAAQVTIIVRIDTVTCATERDHPDYDPTDADLAPNWGALSVAEQHEVSARLHAAIEAGH